MTILGLMGPAGCGKDTIFEFLKEYGYKRAASADTMKEDLSRYLNLSMSDIDYYKDKDLGIMYSNMVGDVPLSNFSIRTFLQEYGMDLRNQFGTDYWINRSVTEKLKEHIEKEEIKLVITDVRFQNEIDYIHKRGGRVAFIKGRSSLIGKHKEHISEEMANRNDIENLVDFTINNSGTLKQLKEQVDETIDFISS